MKRPLGTLVVLLVFALLSLAQDTGSAQRTNQVPVSGQMAGPNGNLSACQHGWTECDRSKLTPSEAAEVEMADRQRNVSDCRDRMSSCNLGKLSDAERAALAVAGHDDNVVACNNGY